MGFLQKVTTKRERAPRRTLIYGVSGVGKTTFASQWPKAIVLPTEDGVGEIEVPAFPLAKSFVDAGGPIQELIDRDHDYKTIVVDSADWLEKLIWEHVCGKHDKQHITELGYGKGYAESAGLLQKYLQWLTTCRDRGMHVVVVAHAAITRFEDPEGEAYDRYQPKLHREAAAVLIEWADEVLFANYRTYTRQTDEGFGRKRAIGTGSGDRVLHTEERPAWKAKNRLGLPPELPLSFAEYSKYLSLPTAKKEEKENG